MSEGRVCRVKGCDGAVVAKGFCAKHYERWWDYHRTSLHSSGGPPDGRVLINMKGYRVFFVDNSLVFEHVYIYEQDRGRRLNPGEIVHHIDGDKANNNIDNLMRLSGRAEHALIHRRMRAEEACGHPDWRRCYICKEYDDPNNLTVGGRANHHPACQIKRQRNLYAAKKQAVAI